MKKHFTTIILIMIFFIGLSVLLYPAISNCLNQIDATYAVINYNEALTKMDEASYDDLIAKAEEYNRRLASSPQCFTNGPPKEIAYKSLLDITGDGMIGYISIMKSGLMLPIYHGTSNTVLKTNTGHLEGSSLPIGGLSTHAVISGHRGLPGAKLFTDLDQLKIGDTFMITILNKTLYYQVDQIKIVLPEEFDDLDIIANEDHVTLVTCTPYAVNTHRLLVRGRRIDVPEEIQVTTDTIQIDLVILVPVVVILILLMLIIIFIVSRQKK